MAELHPDDVKALVVLLLGRISHTVPMLTRLSDNIDEIRAYPQVTPATRSGLRHQADAQRQVARMLADTVELVRNIEQEAGALADPIYAYVPHAALAELVTYADGQRMYADSQFVCGPDEQKRSDDEFRAKVQALGVSGLLPDEDGVG